jgi:Fic family protein
VTALSYQETHPWLTFELDLGSVGASFWMQLGECRSKMEHIAGVPLRPETANKMHTLYLAKGALATTAIEGNTLSEEEALGVIEGRVKLPPSKQYLAEELRNIVEACEQIFSATDLSYVLTPEDIKRFNRLALEGLSLEEGVVPGEYRTHEVVVGNYRGCPARDCPGLVDELCNWLNSAPFGSEDPELAIPIAILKAILAHLYLAWIHPFGDGNGRTARLVEFAVLVSAGVPKPAAHLLSNHYNLTRSEYYRQLDAGGRHAKGKALPFIEYAVQGLIDGLKEQVDFIRDQQLDVTWENYVHEAFRKLKGPTHERQKWLVLDLSNFGRPQPRGKLRILSQRLADAYSNKTEKTLTRDINFLLGMGLIQKVPDGVVAARGVIEAFLPARASSDAEARRKVAS